MREGPSLKPLPSGLTPAQHAAMLDRWLSSAIGYSQRKRRKAQTASSVVKLGTLALTAASTIILGVQDLDFWTGVGFALVALATVAGAIEPFFNWRSRWVLMEEQLHRFHRLREEFAMRVATTPADDLTHELVEQFYAEYRDVWAATSQRWLEDRRAGDRG